MKNTINKIEEHLSQVDKLISELKGGLAKWELLVDEANKTKTKKPQS